MDYVGIKSMKEAYAEQLVEEGDIRRAEEVQNSSVLAPVYSGYAVHPEEEPSVDAINKQFREMAIDIHAVRQEIKHAAEGMRSLMNTIDIQLKYTDELLSAEEDRVRDMNIICGNYQEFATVRTLTESDFNGDYGVEDDGKTFTCRVGEEKEVELSVLQVAGNGYEGNGYVKSGSQFQSEKVTTVDRDNMLDGSMHTCYEYSRLTSDGEDEYPGDVNMDKEEARCSITLMGNVPFSAIKLDSDQEDIVVEDLLTSDDNGASFKSHMPRPVSINSQTEKYTKDDYVYNSGVLVFPSTQIVRVALKSAGTTAEQLAFQKIDVTDEKNPKSQIIDLPNTKRHVIRVNDVSAKARTYIGKTTMRTNELITGGPVSSIAIFANEHIPYYYPESKDYIRYILTINGTDYDITPINSYRTGKKIYRCTEHSYLDSYVQKLPENIKSATLTVIIQTPEEQSSPYITNLKVCLGKAVTKD